MKIFLIITIILATQIDHLQSARAILSTFLIFLDLILETLYEIDTMIHIGFKRRPGCGKFKLPPPRSHN